MSSKEEKMKHITPKITSPQEDGRIRIGVFAVNNPKDKEALEEILNDPEITIISEDGPNLDKAGRSIMTVKWKEPLES